MSRLNNRLRFIVDLISRHWFLFGLMFVIPMGIGLSVSPFAGQLALAAKQVPGNVLNALILFLMSATLDSRHLYAAMKSPLAVVTASLVNQVAIPLMAIPLLPLISSTDLRLGVLIAATVPCTMAAASVWTRMANGNDAVSLLVTLLTNVLCFLVIPSWLAIAAGRSELDKISEALSFFPMLKRLTIGAVLPALAGQAVRLIPLLRALIDRNRKVCSNSAQGTILFIVGLSAFSGGLQVTTHSAAPKVSAFVISAIICVFLHVSAIGLGYIIARRLKIPAADRVAVLFAGSQKTLPVGLMVSQASGIPLSIVPILIYHASQLFIDTWVVSRVRVPKSHG